MAITGLERTYDNSTVIHEDLEDVIASISPTDAPMFALLNRMEVFDDQHYWVEDELRQMTATLSQALTGSTLAVDMRVQTGQGARIPAAATKPILLRLDEEFVLATSRTTDAITITRDYNSSGTAAHASSGTVEIIYDQTYQGADARSALAQSRSKPYNYTQIFEKTLQVSGTMDAVDAAGIRSSESDYQEQQRLKEIKIELERSIIFGTRKVGAAAAAAGMGGFHHFISSNANSNSAAAITRANIEDDARACFDAGGRPGILLCNSIQSQKISNLFTSEIRRDASTAENALGGLQIGRLQLPIAGLGELAIIVDRWVPQHEYYILSPELIWLGYLTGRQFFVSDLARTGDATKRHVVGEYTLIMKNEKAHARRYSLAIT